MKEYGDFAQVYDLFMENIPYEEWLRYILDILDTHGIKDGLVVDLGCGTGTLTELLASRGYDMIGVDASVDMLSQAAEKKLESGSDILYLEQDIRELDLYGTVNAVVSVCDTMNYLLETEDFIETLKRVNAFLNPRGVFIFDLKTINYFRETADAGVDAVNEEHASYILENVFDEDSRINEGALTIFEETESGLYRRTEEFHYQRGYSAEEVRNMVSQAGMELIGFYGDTDKSQVSEEVDRFYCIVQEKGK